MTDRTHRVSTLMLLAVCLALAGCAPESGASYGSGPVIYFDLFPELGFWQPSGAVHDMKIRDASGAAGGTALEIEPYFVEDYRRCLLLRYIPFIRAHRVRFRIWNSVPQDEGEVFVRGEITDANNKVHLLKMYGNTAAFRPDSRRSMLPVIGEEVAGAPVPFSGNRGREGAGWVTYEATLPQDIETTLGEGMVDVGYFSPGDRYKITPERMIPIKQFNISIDLPPGSTNLYHREDLRFYIDRLEFIGYPQP
ncbi:hypothetical protein [Kiritimatiella glycovorans]|uniref:Lipoprotein n=1 Tax=Kiritimatiella glycovorans TaxID=1307763 RepID=A0A0G3EN71_9BACT|nr:hypothetical protein [Kiritimatiella glycovorans]AKJ65599.1 hypothetical protein L21SP4_02373 [Kiritimatiella glycovorans]